LVEKSGLDAKAKAQAAASAARAELDSAPEVEEVKKALIALVDAEPTKAAKHRFLQSLHLTHLSYGSFIKEQMAGTHLLKWKSGASLIEAGVKLGLPQAIHLAAKCTQLEKLQAAVWNVQLKTVPTGARWMAA
jgi:hypothetical protein